MRVRITSPARGEVDGIRLEAFQVGLIYDVAPSLGTYLITTSTAEPVGTDEPALVTPLSDAKIAATAERLRSVANDSGRHRAAKSGVTDSDPSDVR